MGKTQPNDIYNIRPNGQNKQHMQSLPQFQQIKPRHAAIEREPTKPVAKKKPKKLTTKVTHTDTEA